MTGQHTVEELHRRVVGTGIAGRQCQLIHNGRILQNGGERLAVSGILEKPVVVVFEKKVHTCGTSMIEAGASMEHAAATTTTLSAEASSSAPLLPAGHVKASPVHRAHDEPSEAESYEQRMQRLKNEFKAEREPKGTRAPKEKIAKNIQKKTTTKERTRGK